MGIIVFPSVTLQPAQQTTLSATAVFNGTPEDIAGIPSWSTDRTDLITLTPDDSGFSCVVTSVSPLPVVSGGIATVTTSLQASQSIIFGYCTVYVVPTPVDPEPNAFDISIGEVTSSV
jgi:hypothetical protein